MLQKPGAINDLAKLQKLPKTIKEAISLAILLKERYIWIDTLCIVQDDNEMKHSQFNNMASIFANSHLTIVAKDGKDANHGLRGLRGLSQCRTLEQEDYYLTPRLRLRDAKEYEHLYRTTVWGSRGWTFQEDIFSPRKLTFLNGRVSWICSAGHWDEEVWHIKTAESLVRTSCFGAGLEVFTAPFAALSGYFDLVRDYNHRKLSYPEDSLFAFSGITTALSQVFPGGFISGLPQMFFDVTLLWLPREIAKWRTQVGNSKTRPYLPSWSWVGWECSVDDKNCDAGFNYIRRASPRHERDVHGSSSGHTFIPLVQWFFHEDIMTSRQRVVCTWQQHFPACWDALHPLPEGWTRHQCTPGLEMTGSPWAAPLPHPQAPFFRHESILDTDFWFPIPLKSDVVSCNSNARYISGRTQKAQLCTGETTKSALSGLTFVLLHEENGTLVGILSLDQEEDPNLILGSSLELIALSRDSVDPKVRHYRAPEELEMDPKLRSQALYEFYHVMWIGWDNGIALRRGIGRIFKDAWERQDLDWIDVTLG